VRDRGCTTILGSPVDDLPFGSRFRSTHARVGFDSLVCWVTACRRRAVLIDAIVNLSGVAVGWGLRTQFRIRIPFTGEMALRQTTSGNVAARPAAAPAGSICRLRPVMKKKKKFIERIRSLSSAERETQIFGKRDKSAA